MESSEGGAAGERKLTDEEEKSKAAAASYHMSSTASGNVQQLMNTDSNDESLRKYKQQLLGAAASGDLGDPSDPRRVFVTEFRVVFEESVPEQVFHLDTPEGIRQLETTGIHIKEGSNFRFHLAFRVQFTNTTRRAMISLGDEVTIGSYPPSATSHTFDYPRYGWSEAPKGMLMRGRYMARDTFIDGDGVTHLQYEYPVCKNLCH